ncbi:preprotein translocase subunit SecE [Candidatus Mycoplasma mahonii]|uniref:preprotein translocase subunit SecE n=1 Tax=Candidatus Mycoplasma mahonii TaxID=3004105 RepID=UPI0026EA7B0D|nr:preprotein translocase subunit SecE [Candidatus Mycoplasma mahonii]WKX02652.1 preprotein translocase subunit SecE [Candidatus Mycoplasma mahonii]
MNWLKKIVKEIKRVRWPTANDANRTYVITLIFMIISSLILFGVAIGFTTLWSTWGVGLNG